MEHFYACEAGLDKLKFGQPESRCFPPPVLTLILILILILII
jgi:hypothetical protein